LLAAARALFAARGYSVGIAQICREADVAIGTFYSNFQDKADLMSALIDEERSRLIAIERLSPAQLADLGTVIAEALRRPESALYRAIHQAGASDAALQQKTADLLRDARARFATVVRRARAERRSARPMLDPEAAAWAAVAAAWHQLGPAGLAEGEATATLAGVVQVLTFGEDGATR
jgi:AcrR family transcriptional regulator